jgi:hypothetical protein
MNSEAINKLAEMPKEIIVYINTKRVGSFPLVISKKVSTTEKINDENKSRNTKIVGSKILLEEATSASYPRLLKSK